MPRGPVAQQRLNESLSVAIGARRVGPREAVAQLPRATNPGESARLIGRAVVGEQTPADDAAAAKPDERMPQKRGAGATPLRPANFDIGDARRIVDRDMDVFVADASLSHGLVPLNAMADPADPTEWLDVQVQEIARVRPLVALNDRRRIQPAHPIQAGAPHTRATVERGTPTRALISHAVARCWR